MAGKCIWVIKYANNAYNRTDGHADRGRPNVTVHLRLRQYICLGAQVVQQLEKTFAVNAKKMNIFNCFHDRVQIFIFVCRIIYHLSNVIRNILNIFYLSDLNKIQIEMIV